MQLKSLDFFFKHFAEEQMNFLYTGDFSDEHTDGFIELNNNQYNAADEFKKSQRKVGFLIAECFQNIVRHNDSSHRDSYFHIKNNDGLFSIVSGNTVKNEIIPSLKGQLEQLNKLTSVELKEEYRRILANGAFSDKGGAGLGLIEMARRSKNKLSFNFANINELKSYFYFRLHFKLDGSSENLINNDFNNSISLRDKMLSEDIFFIYKGVISVQTTIVILGIIEKSISSVNQKVVFVKFMGLFEKISGLKLPLMENNATMLFIGENDEEYSIGASCFLNYKEASRIDRMLKLYAFYDSKTLDNEYKRIIKEGSQNSINEYSLEIIEILKNCAGFEFDIRSYANDVAFVTMLIKFEKKKENVYPAFSASKKMGSTVQAPSVLQES